MEAEAELTVDEMLADPIVHLVMRRDGGEEADVRARQQLVAWRLQPATPHSLSVWPQGMDDLKSDVALPLGEHPPATSNERSPT
jgi:hypothetical protein